MQPEQRRLAAILAADVAGYSRLMAADELGTMAQLKRFRTEAIEPKITQFQGRIVGSAGQPASITQPDEQTGPLLTRRVGRIR